MSSYRKTMRQALEEMYPPVPASLEEQVVVELDEAKYDLYHKDFSSAMQHAYKMAKKLHGITVDPKEIDDKVASGPRKPSEGKTNSYRLEGDKGSIQVQVYNKGGPKPFELNFYKEEVELDENVIDKVKEIASKKSAAKIDGVMVDSFTASAISQIYDKVNDASKKKMDGLPITKLATLAMKMMQKNEYVPEEANLDEKEITLFKSKQPTAYDRMRRRMNPKDSKTVDASDEKQIKDLESRGWHRSPYDEEADLDEGTKQVLAHGGKGQYKAVRDGGITKIMYKGKVVGTADFDSGADSFFVSMKGVKGQKSFDDAQAMVDYFAKNKIKEEDELDEASSLAQQAAIAISKKERDNKPKKEEADLDEGKMKDAMMDAEDMMYDGKSDDEIMKATQLSSKDIKMIRKKLPQESVELDEAEDFKPHKMYDPETGKEYDAKTMDDHLKYKKMGYTHEKPEVEESAASDARRAIALDPSTKQKFSKNVSATDDDVKSADKNVMMQMRKAVSLRGNKVEFMDKKKVEIPQKIAQAVLDKYNSQKRPADKEKFQTKVSKSYKDMLQALKETNEKMDTFHEVKSLMRKFRENDNG